MCKPTTDAGLRFVEDTEDRREVQSIVGSESRKNCIGVVSASSTVNQQRVEVTSSDPVQ